ncbi:MAG: type II CAAX endopeptidase family protein [Phycisphaerae bacterium]|jgi:membrane protease YdiL (CAAX protease family)
MAPPAPQGNPANRHRRPASTVVGVIGLIALTALIATGDIIAGRALQMFMLLAAASVLVRYVRLPVPLVELVDIVLLYRALRLAVQYFGVYWYLPTPFPELLIAVALIAFDRFLRGRSCTELSLRWPTTRRAWALTIPFALLSIAGLAWWHFFIAERPLALARMLPPWSTAALLAAVPAVAITNALFEEFLARVVLQSEARRVAGVWPAIFFQAALFGTMHYRSGFPNGWVGVGLTFTFGWVMGVLTYRTRSVWPAVAVHAICDAFIVTSVVLERG